MTDGIRSNPWGFAWLKKLKLLRHVYLREKVCTLKRVKDKKIVLENELI